MTGSVGSCPVYRYILSNKRPGCLDGDPVPRWLTGMVLSSCGTAPYYLSCRSLAATPPHLAVAYREKRRAKRASASSDGRNLHSTIIEPLDTMLLVSCAVFFAYLPNTRRQFITASCSDELCTQMNYVFHCQDTPDSTAVFFGLGQSHGQRDMGRPPAPSCRGWWHKEGNPL